AEVEHDRVPAVQREILATPFHGSDAVIYAGPHCSPFVNLARSVRKELRIHELEDDEGSLDQFRRRRGAKQIPHLIVEDATSLPRVFEDASETLSRARLDRIHFFVPEGGSIPNPADELSAYGYVLLGSRGGKLENAPCAARLTSGCYVAVHE